MNTYKDEELYLLLISQTRLSQPKLQTCHIGCRGNAIYKYICTTAHTGHIPTYFKVYKDHPIGMNIPLGSVYFES